MQHLRHRVDRIDLKILRLLQQRTKLSDEIGKTKRRHGAVIYVPERESELIARVKRLSRDKLPVRAVTAIYREILSGSRAAQGQGAIGLLHASRDVVLLPGRWCFGACDEFLPKKTWKEIADGLDQGSLALALLTGEDLMRVLQTAQGRQRFFERFTVVGDFPSLLDSKVPLSRRIFIVTPHGQGAFMKGNRLLILIKCKSTVNAVKSLLKSMPDCSIHAEEFTPRAKSARGGTVWGLACLTLPKPLDGIRATGQLLAARQLAGVSASILGVYLSSENYGG
ncbi:chorismate mutase [Methylacidiphilales bacterium]|nr:chorismate mutase [Candidatus Methylacidiphilales bacterium]